MLTGNAEDLDVVMPMSNVIEQRRNYRKTTGSIRNYYRDEPGDPRTDSQSLKYKTNITGSTPGNDDKKKHHYHNTIKVFEQFLENFKYSINCEVNLVLMWSKNV